MSTSSAGPGSDEGTWLGVAVHVIGLLFSVLGAGLVVLVADGEFDARNAANALNWQLFLLVAWLGIAALTFGLAGVLASAGVIGSSATLVLSVVGGLVLLVLGLANLAFSVLATIRATDGTAWEYPVAPALV